MSSSLENRSSHLGQTATTAGVPASDESTAVDRRDATRVRLTLPRCCPPPSPEVKPHVAAKKPQMVRTKMLMMKMQMKDDDAKRAFRGLLQCGFFSGVGHQRRFAVVAAVAIAVSRSRCILFVVGLVSRGRSP